MIREHLLERQAELAKQAEQTDRFLDELIGIQVLGDDGSDDFATANRERLLGGLHDYRAAVARGSAEVDAQLLRSAR
jgi:hypothetical protein